MLIYCIAYKDSQGYEAEDSFLCEAGVVRVMKILDIQKGDMLVRLCKDVSECRKIIVVQEGELGAGFCCRS